MMELLCELIRLGWIRIRSDPPGPLPPAPRAGQVLIISRQILRLSVTNTVARAFAGL